MAREIILGGIYQHFKGNKYRVLGTATHTESGDTLVLYDDAKGNTYARPYDIFISEVDHHKYPDITQKYRFTLIGDIYSHELSEDN